MNDYMAHIFMIIICITAHQCVITDILTIRAYTTYKAIFIFIFITQIVLVCFSGKINNLYDV